MEDVGILPASRSTDPSRMPQVLAELLVGREIQSTGIYFPPMGGALFSSCLAGLPFKLVSVERPQDCWSEVWFEHPLGHMNFVTRRCLPQRKQQGCNRARGLSSRTNSARTLIPSPLPSGAQ